MVCRLLLKDDPESLCLSTGQQQQQQQQGESTASISIGPLTEDCARDLVWEAARAGMFAEPYDPVTQTVVVVKDRRPEEFQACGGDGGGGGGGGDVVDGSGEDCHRSEWKRAALDEVTIRCSAVGTKEAFSTVREIYAAACQQAGARSRLLLESPHAVGAVIAACWQAPCTEPDAASHMSMLVNSVMLPDGRLPEGYQAAALGTASAIAANAQDWATVSAIHSALSGQISQAAAMQREAAAAAAAATAAAAAKAQEEGADDDFEEFFEELDIEKSELEAADDARADAASAATLAASVYVSNAISSFVRLCEVRPEHEAVGKLADYYERLARKSIYCPLATENLLENTDGNLHHCSLSGLQPATF